METTVYFYEEYNKIGVEKKTGYSHELNSKVDETSNKCIFLFNNSGTLWNFDMQFDYVTNECANEYSRFSHIIVE